MCAKSRRAVNLVVSKSLLSTLTCTGTSRQVRIKWLGCLGEGVRFMRPVIDAVLTMSALRLGNSDRLDGRVEQSSTPFIRRIPRVI